MGTLAYNEVAVNGICPYFTMFPLNFPFNVLKRRATGSDYVLDPFCGRGTTNFAARLLGLRSLGVDSSPVAVAITASKLVSVTVGDVVEEARGILSGGEAREIPEGVFWEWGYHYRVLRSLCRFREALLENCSTPQRIALRGIIMGALHGPRQKGRASYLSNQCPRTYAPKPAYATRYWRHRGLRPEPVDVLRVVEERAKRYYGYVRERAGAVRLADSRNVQALRPEKKGAGFRWVVTSPPYYGMRTYIPDQWLRNWFVGGSDTVDYGNRDQVVHSGTNHFVGDLRKVWSNVAQVCEEDATMVVRFGGITDRRANPLDLIKESLEGTGWGIKTIRAAGTAMEGKRQADAFLRAKSQPMTEYDVWARRR